MRSVRPLAFLAAAFLFFAGTGCSSSRIKQTKGLDGEVVVAEGMAPYRAEALTETKAEALAAAQRAAVEQVVGVYVTGKTRVDKAALVEREILANTSGYIKRYEILSEGRSGEWYRTKIRALVSTQRIHKKLESEGLLHKASIGYPRVAIALQEFVGEKANADKPATQALTGVLLKQGYKVVELSKPIPVNEDAVEAAKSIPHTSAELLIAGMARAQSLGYASKDLGGMGSYRASVNFRVIETGTGEVLSTVSKTASGAEATPELASDKSLQEAAEQAGAVLANLPEELDKRAHVLITIVGITSFETLGKFQKDLSSQRGVKEEYLRSYTQAAGTAVIDVLADQLTPQEVAEMSVRLGGPTWSVYQVSGRSVQISASQAGR
ncbi:MAG: hypothetical protein WC859_05630 [Elusimicrobiota bacterium]|jgi:hypothetical protein